MTILKFRSPSTTYIVNIVTNWKLQEENHWWSSTGFLGQEGTSYGLQLQFIRRMKDIRMSGKVLAHWYLVFSMFFLFVVGELSRKWLQEESLKKRNTEVVMVNLIWNWVTLYFLCLVAWFSVLFFAVMVNLTEAMCWKMVAKTYFKRARVGLVIYQKPDSSSCYENRKENNPPMCNQNHRLNSSWYAWNNLMKIVIYILVLITLFP